MKPSYPTIRKWLVENSCNCSLEQLRELERILARSIVDAEAEDKEAKRVLSEAEELVKRAEQLVSSKLGVSLSEAKARVRAGVVIAASGQGTELASGKRRPYLNPLNPQSPSYGKFNKDPDWLKQLREQTGKPEITIHHCRADRLIESSKLFEFSLPWPNPEAYLAEVQIREGLRQRRKPSVKKGT